MFNRKKAVAAMALATAATMTLAGCGGNSDPEAAPTFDPNEAVTLDLAFWGNDARAELYNEAIAAFNEEYPNITVNTSFLGFPEFWEKRQTEAAGGNLPDVLQFDYAYLRQYSQNGLLLDLGPFLGNIIDTEPLAKNILEIGVVDDVTTALPIGTNAWGLYTNPKFLEQAGVEEFAGGDWDDYSEWMAEVTDAADGAFFGGTDYTIRIQNLELQLRSEDSYLFNDAGEPGFDKERLAEFWRSGAADRDSKATIASQTLEEIFPKSGFETARTASELTWDNFGAGYLAGLGAEYKELGLIAPPVTKEGAKDLFLKPSMLHSISANTDHPEAAATLVNFLINSPASAEVFGTNRGLPASESALEGAALDPLSQQILDYEESIADRLGDAAPVPIVGYGSLEEKFRQLGVEIGFGSLSVDDAVDQFFAEMDVVLNQ